MREEKRKNERTNEPTNERTNEQVDGRTVERTNCDGTNERSYERTVERTSARTNERHLLTTCVQPCIRQPSPPNAFTFGVDIYNPIALKPQQSRVPTIETNLCGFTATVLDLNLVTRRILVLYISRRALKNSKRSTILYIQAQKLK